jgi:sialate O-acetylesterase
MFMETLPNSLQYAIIDALHRIHIHAWSCQGDLMMPALPTRSILLVICLALGGTPGQADDNLPLVHPLFGDHLVLQHDRKDPIWGWAAPGTQVTVGMSGMNAAAVADASGRWQTQIGPFASGGPFTLVITGPRTITLRDVLVGEVWVCSGQSNMAMSMLKTPENSDGGVDDAPAEVAAANYPNIRLFIANAPITTGTDAWTPCSPATVGRFSAAGYYFARDLHRRLHIPFGMIMSAIGGSAAEQWTPPAAVTPALTQAEIEAYRRQFALTLADYSRSLTEWRIQADKAKAAGTAVPPEPGRPNGPDTPWYGNLYQQQIEPLLPYGIRGVIWYQGESNTRRAYSFPILMEALIGGWRHAWNQGDFPFIQVQLAAHISDEWDQLREAQEREARHIPQCALATVHDIGGGALHPRNKLSAGLRLSLCAQRLVYGMPEVDCSGPRPEHISYGPSSATVSFTNTAGGLIRQGEHLEGFSLAGADHVFHDALARIAGNQVIMQCAAVPVPIAVRYGWHTWNSTLYGGKGLPAFPFRSDDWDGPAP